MTTTKRRQSLYDCVNNSIRCSDDYCCDSGAGRTRSHAANSADNSWDSSTHSHALGRCEQTSSRNVTDTSLQSSCDRTYLFHGFRCSLNNGTGWNIPATGPAAPKPTTPSRTGATKGVKTTPVVAVAAQMARPVKTK